LDGQDLKRASCGKRVFLFMLPKSPNLSTLKDTAQKIMLPIMPHKGCFGRKSLITTGSSRVFFEIKETFIRNVGAPSGMLPPTFTCLFGYLYWLTEW
jgi:hypothetical protein